MNTLGHTNMSGMPWLTLCKFFERLQCGKHGDDITPQHKRGLLKELFDEHRYRSRPTSDMWAIMRLLLPGYARSGETEMRATYGLKESGIAKTVIAALDLAPTQSYTKRLKEWDQASGGTGHGVFATVLYSVLQDRAHNAGIQARWTIDDANNFLDSLHSLNRRGMQKEQIKLFAHMMGKCTSLEIKWLVSQVLFDLHIPLSENTVLSVYHPDAITYFKFNINLVDVTRKLPDPRKRLNAMTLEVFKPFRPMLSMRFTPQQTKLETVFKNGFWVEPKFDGWRIQLHKSGENIKLYSRTGNNYTTTYMSLVKTIQTERLLKVDKCILDGEILTWDVERNKFGECSTLKTFNHKRPKTNSLSVPQDGGDADSKNIIVLRLWDVLQVNDEVLTELPLKTRRDRLLGIVTEVHPVVEVVRPMKRNGASTLGTWEDVKQLLHEAKDQGDEGLVLKDPSSKYTPHSRRTGEWMKLKPDYFQNGVEEFDLLIVGAMRGTGAMTDMFCNFLLALAEDTQCEDPTPTRFRSVSHLGSGLTRDQLHGLKKILEKHMVHVDFKKHKSTETLHRYNTGRDQVEFVSHKRSAAGPAWIVAKWHKTDTHDAVQVVYSGLSEEDVHWVVDPRYSVVVTVIADFRLIPSETFAMKHTLRFPRLRHDGLRVRNEALKLFGDEKAWYDCMRVSEWDLVVQASTAVDGAGMGIGGSAGGCFDHISDTGQRRKKEASTASAARKGALLASQAWYGGEKRFDMLSEYVIHVQHGSTPEQTKQAHQTIAALGGTVIATDPGVLTSQEWVRKRYTGKTKVVIAYNTISHHFARCQREDRDVANSTWLFDCLKEATRDPLAQPLQFQPKYMLNTSIALEKCFAEGFDIFGDSYTERFKDVSELDSLLDQEGATWEEMSECSDGYVSDEAMARLERDLMQDDPSQHLEWSVFAGVVALILQLDVDAATQIPVLADTQIPVLAMARGRLVAGGAIIATSDNASLAHLVTHVVVMESWWTHLSDDPDVGLYELLYTLRGALKSSRTHQEKWVVVSEAWVKARKFGRSLPQPLLTQCDVNLMQGNPSPHPPSGVFAGVVALLLQLDVDDAAAQMPVLAMARGHLVEGGAVIAAPDDSSSSSVVHSVVHSVTHVVVVDSCWAYLVNNPDVGLYELLYTVRSQLESLRCTTKKHTTTQYRDEWMVVSEAWVKARNFGHQLPEPLLTQCDVQMLEC